MEVHCNGCTFRCSLEGRADAPLVTLSHGLATDMTMWDDLVPRLTQRYCVLRYDSRGHGGSAATAGDYSLAMLEDDVIGILDALDFARTHFVGLSMGGMVGLGLALNRPNRMASVAVCDARGSAPAEYRAAWSDRGQKVRDGGIEAMVEPSVTRWFTPGFQRSHPEIIDRMRDVVRRTSPDGYCGSAAALRELDYERLLPDTLVPMLFMTGSGDQGAPPAVVRAMQAKAPCSHYVELPDAGHISVMEQPALFAAAILDFVEGIEMRSTSTA
jgi:3-oxoadipate enol-lactonase